MSISPGVQKWASAASVTLLTRRALWVAKAPEPAITPSAVRLARWLASTEVTASTRIEPGAAMGSTPEAMNTPCPTVTDTSLLLPLAVPVLRFARLETPTPAKPPPAPATASEPLSLKRLKAVIATAGVQVMALHACMPAALAIRRVLSAIATRTVVSASCRASAALRPTAAALVESARWAKASV